MDITSTSGKLNALITDIMASCYWAQPAQLHPWYKLDTMKRKLPPMLPRSESPSPADEYGPDPRAKRPRCTTPDQMRSTKRKLPSPPQSPVEGLDFSGPDDPRLFKRQRCTALERGLESLSLTTLPASAQVHALAPLTPNSTSADQTQATPELSARLPPSLAAPLVSAAPVRHQHEPPEFAHSRWLEMPSSSLTATVHKSRSIPLHPTPISTSITYVTSAPTLTSDADAITDVKMHSSSWYEPEKDRTCLFSLTLFLFFLVGCAELFADRENTRLSLPSPVRFLVLYPRPFCNRNCHYRSGRVL